MLSETEIIKHLNYPGITLIRNKQELYEENQRLKEEDLNGDKVHIPQWKDRMFVKKTILPKLFCRFNVIQTNIPERLIYRVNEMFL